MGFITNILKMLIAPTIAKEIGKTYDKLYDDPEYRDNIRTIQTHIRKLEKALEQQCKEHPDLPKCKRLRDIYLPMKSNSTSHWK